MLGEPCLRTFNVIGPNVQSELKIIKRRILVVKSYYAAISGKKM